MSKGKRAVGKYRMENISSGNEGKNLDAYVYKLAIVKINSKMIFKNLTPACGTTEEYTEAT